MRGGYRWRTDLLKGPFVILLSLAIPASGLVAGPRKGARVIVKTRDGQAFLGELLAVREDHLTLLDNTTASEVTESLQAIKTITVVKKRSTKVGELVAGALGGALCGLLIQPHSDKPDPASDFYLTPASAAMAGAIGGAFWGAIIFGLGSNKDIKITNSDPKSIAKISARLKKYARDRG